MCACYLIFARNIVLIELYSTLLYLSIADTDLVLADHEILVSGCGIGYIAVNIGFVSRHIENAAVLYCKEQCILDDLIVPARSLIKYLAARVSRFFGKCISAVSQTCDDLGDNTALTLFGDPAVLIVLDFIGIALDCQLSACNFVLACQVELIDGNGGIAVIYHNDCAVYCLAVHAGDSYLAVLGFKNDVGSYLVALGSSFLMESVGTVGQAYDFNGFSARDP